MKRYYICPKSVLEEESMLLGQMQSRHILFAGTQWIELSDGHILLCSDFRSEDAEELWHAHPEVARLAHPENEKHVPIGHLHAKPEHAHKKFKPHHLEKLKILGITEHHTVLDMHDLLKDKYPGMKLSSRY
jgi:hypothetical protein